MTKARKKFDPAFKAKTALEALREDVTVLELAKRRRRSPQQIYGWRKLAPDNASSLFERGAVVAEAGEEARERELAKLYQEIPGQGLVAPKTPNSRMGRPLPRMPRRCAKPSPESPGLNPHPSSTSADANQCRACLCAIDILADCSRGSARRGDLDLVVKVKFSCVDPIYAVPITNHIL